MRNNTLHMHHHHTSENEVGFDIGIHKSIKKK